MEKTSHSVPEPSVNRVMQRPLYDLNQLPMDMSVAPKDDVSPLPPFVIHLCFHNEDMEVLTQKYKVLSSSSSVTNNDHLKNLGFQGGCQTMMHIRNKKANIPRNSHHALGRSLFKEFIKKDEGVDWMVSLPEPMCACMAQARMKGNKDKEKADKHDAEHLAAKNLLKEFVLLAKVRASTIKKEKIETKEKKEKKKGKKKVRFACGPLDGIRKRKCVPKRWTNAWYCDN